MELPGQLTPTVVRDMRWAMRLSLWVGVAMLLGKTGAWLYTGSTAILSDATESIIHVVAVAFAAFSLYVSTRPANRRFRYGYERISFFSAGFEGAMIVAAALFIIVESIRAWITGLELQNLGAGTAIIVAAGLVNAGLGIYLIRTGRRTHSMILEANGKQVLTDSWTSLGVVLGLVLVQVTGWEPFDPICAIAVAINILWSGGNLVRRSVSGLMDYADPKIGETLKTVLDEACADFGAEYHDLRWRSTGYRTRVELHLLFPDAMSVGEAHRRATEIETRMEKEVGTPLQVSTHLESLEDHEAVHAGERHEDE